MGPTIGHPPPPPHWGDFGFVFVRPLFLWRVVGHISKLGKLHEELCNPSPLHLPLSTRGGEVFMGGQFCGKISSFRHGGLAGTRPFMPTPPPPLEIGRKVPDHGRRRRPKQILLEFVEGEKMGFHPMLRRHKLPAL